MSSSSEISGKKSGGEKGISAHHLFELVDEDRLHELTKLSTANLMVRDSQGDTLLHRVVQKCETVDSLDILDEDPNAPMAQYLLSAAPELACARNSNGETPLCCACKNVMLGIQMTIALVQAYPKSALSIPDNEGNTPLHHLVGVKFYRAPRSFCDMTMYPEAIYHSESDAETLTEKLRCHLYHCLCRYEAAVPLILEKGADIDAEDANGLTPLICSLIARFKINLPVDYDKTIEILLDKGAALCTKQGKHALSYARNLKFAQLIVQRDRGELNRQDERCWTPLHHVMTQCCVEQLDIVRFLIDQGACLEPGLNLVDLARQLEYPFSFIEPLLDDYDINTRDENGATLLIQYGNTLEIIDKLLALGVDVSAVDNNGRNAWWNAWTIEDPRAARRLIDAGVDASTEKEIISVFMGHYCRKTHANSEEWFELIKFVMALPKFQTPLSLKNILISVKAGIIGPRGFDKSRDFKVLKYIVDNHSDVTRLLCDAPIYCQAAGLMFPGSQLDPIGWMLCCTGMLYHDNYPIDEYIMFLFKVGFILLPAPVHRVTPLTALLTIPQGSRNCDFRVFNLAKEFIARGVNVESQALQFHSQQRELESRMRTMHLPDALLLAFLNNRRDVVSLLLPYWWAPPLALLCFSSRLSDVQFAGWFALLYQGHNLPHGTQMAAIVNEKLRTFLARNDEDLLQPTLAQFQQNHSSPLSLRELCKFSVREMLAPRATYPDTTLQDLLQQVVEPTLHFLVVR